MRGSSQEKRESEGDWDLNKGNKKLLENVGALLQLNVWLKKREMTPQRMGKRKILGNIELILKALWNHACIYSFIL